VDRGVAAERSGSLTQALEYFREAARASPEFAQAHMSIGIALQAKGDLTSALVSLKRAVSLDPRDAAAHYNLGLARFKLDDHREAEKCFREALRLKKPFPEAWVGLAGALEELGRDEEALAALDSALHEREDYVGALLNASLLARKLGRREAAVEYDRRALEIEPEHDYVHYRLGSLLHELGRLPEAEASYRSALALNPESVSIQLGLAAVLLAKAQKSEALALLFDIASREPNNAYARRCLGTGLRGVGYVARRPEEREVLLRLCMAEDVSASNLAPALVVALTNTPGFEQLLKCARRDDDPFVNVDPSVVSFLRDRLVLAALPRMPISSAPLEVVLTHLRRCILQRFALPSGWQDLESFVPAGFLCALAGQCHFAGYAFFASDDELDRVRAIRDALEASLIEQRPLESIEPALAVVAMYGYIDDLKGGERLLEQPAADWSTAFEAIAKEQFDNPRREREIAARVPAITPIRDAISLQVRGQYEEHPFPVWVGGLDRLGPDNIRALSERIRPEGPPLLRNPPVPMLVAGCGTGKQSILLALAYPECEILAIDLSLTSLAYAARMTEQFGVTRITYRQADILDLGGLPQRFSMIDCSGVLHHLSDPLRGWQILAGLLEPDGLMKIGLYSWRARSNIRAAAEYLKSVQVLPTPQGIRRARCAIMSLPEGHPAKDVSSLGDFYTLNGCRDLIMHVQEHQFTLPRIAQCLDQLGLRFLSMEVSPEILGRFRELFPGGGNARDLASWDRFEEKYPSTFIGMYQFWCCRSE